MVADANKQIELLGIQHDDQLIKNATAASNKLAELHRQQLQKEITADQEALRRSEKTEQDKHALEQEAMKGNEEHIKALGERGAISAKEELQRTLALHKREYELE